jgi:hypothetical protein
VGRADFHVQKDPCKQCKRLMQDAAREKALADTVSDEKRAALSTRGTVAGEMISAYAMA